MGQITKLHNLLENISPKTNISELEEAVLEFWEDRDVFNKSLRRREGKEKFTFYDGPPFANGLPHYGHILAMSIKDLFVRYKTMRGFYVPRRNGWDCHGLPVEYQLEKELGISGKKEIEEYGVDKFNQKARDSVFKYVDVWTDIIKRMGRWIDTKHAYATMDKEYIESVWWVFKQLWDKGLVYQDYVSQPYCTRCGTSLSNFETNQGYRDNVPDPSVYIKFKKKNAVNEYFLVWTTTPWTLPANLALAVDEKTLYGKYKAGNDILWIAEERAKNIDGIDVQNDKIGNAVLGGELIGQEYEPLYPISEFSGNRLDNKENAYKIYAADFVTLEDGTGIVHIAPAYGEDDMKLGKKLNLPVVFSCNYQGLMVTEIANGKYIKEADSEIIKDLSSRSLLYKSGTIHHTYPFCWRCDSPLIYIAVNSWFVRVSQIKEDLVDINNKIYWQPNTLKEGRFGNWLEGARDWNIARQRFWGAPIPIWSCENCHYQIAVGSLAELNQAPEFDPHKPQIDKVEIKCQKCHSAMKRIPEVFDCWFESGSMPYGQWHYPFENKEEFEAGFPADFIGEGMDQTRGWFYTMHVLAVALFQESAYKNVVANGILLAEDGRKLSKKLRNFPEPSEVFDKLGADSLRQYLFSASQIGENYYFSDRLVAEESRKTVMPLLNSIVYYKKFLQTQDKEIAQSDKILDDWIDSRVNETISRTTEYLEKYDLTRASRELKLLINDFSVWYLRLSRKREDREFKKKLEATIFKIAQISAPFMPFIAEVVYQSVTCEDIAESVHLTDWPTAGALDQKLLNQMKDARNIVEEALSLRAKAGIKVRQPLAAMSFNATIDKNIEIIILQELNILKVVQSEEIQKPQMSREETKYQVTLETQLTLELKEEGDLREIIRAVQSLRKQKDLLPKDSAEGQIAFIDNQKDQTFIEKIFRATNCRLQLNQPENLADGLEVLLWEGKARISLLG